MQQFNESAIRQWWDIFKNNNNLVEIRLIGANKTASGYFSDVDTLIKEIAPYTAKEWNCYFTINPPKPECYGREQKDRIVEKPKNTTKDNEILCRDWVLIDVDCNRIAGVNATSKEAQYAYAKAEQVENFLVSQGFNRPVKVFSGSGIHLYLKCALACNEGNDGLIRDFLLALGMLFDDANCKIDSVVFNNSRISRLMGTWNRKGSKDSKERPQRICRFLNIPDEIKINEKEFFQKVAALLPKEEAPSKENNYRPINYKEFDLQEFFRKYSIEVLKETRIDRGTRYILKECPFDPSHGSDSMVFQYDTGHLAFFCFHNGCTNNHWREFRAHYDKDAYSRQARGEWQQKDRRERPQVEAPRPVEQPNPDGNEWLNMEDIKYLDLNNLAAIPTGHEGFDRKAMGFILGEITIVSGLNGCVDCDTEYFNGKRWKRIADYKEGELVLQYEADGTARLVKPTMYHKYPCEYLHLIKTFYGVNQCLSDEHNVVYLTSKGNLAKKRMSDLIVRHDGSTHGFNGKFITTFKYDGKGISLTDEQIRVMCAVICDGHFAKIYRDPTTCRINLKKARKKERLERLLREANIPFRKEQYNPNDPEFNTYLFSAPRIEKEFTTYWYNCSQHQLQIITEEVLNWDGCVRHGRKSFTSNCKQTIDFLQFAYAACGKRTSIRVDDRVGRKHSNGKYEYKSVCYELHICSNPLVSMINVKDKTPIRDYKTKDGYKYCFTVDSGMLVLRREGRINITGNSGKSSWLNCVSLNAIQRGFKVAMFSGELMKEKVKTWLNQAAAGKEFVKKVYGYDDFYYVPKDVTAKIDAWTKDKLFLYDNKYGRNWSRLLESIKNVVTQKGVNLLILDNLMTLDLDAFSGDKNEKQSAFVNSLADLAKQANIHIVLVAHPRKSLTFLRREDIGGSGDITNLADNVYIIHRCNKDFEKRAPEFLGMEEVTKIVQYDGYSNVVEVCKNRFIGSVDNIFGYHYELETKRFIESKTEHVVYGWNPPVIQQNMDFDDFSEDNNEWSVNEFNDLPPDDFYNN